MQRRQTASWKSLRVREHGGPSEYTLYVEVHNGKSSVDPDLPSPFVPCPFLELWHWESAASCCCCLPTFPTCAASSQTPLFSLPLKGIQSDAYLWPIVSL